MHKLLSSNSEERKVLLPEIWIIYGQFNFVLVGTLASPYCLFECFKTAFVLQLTNSPYLLDIFAC